jgi:hypothetical protein
MEGYILSSRKTRYLYVGELGPVISFVFFSSIVYFHSWQLWFNGS